MFDGLTGKLKGIVRRIGGQKNISESDIRVISSEIKSALLEADVPLSVIDICIGKLEARALGNEIAAGLNAGQTLIQIVAEELATMMGGSSNEISLRSQPPAIIMLVGLQGSGKTTSAAKLASWLIKNKKKKDIMMVSTDVYRPAAMEQLKILGDSLKIPVIATDNTENPTNILKRAINDARRNFADVLIVDTAGRLHVEDELMGELKEMVSIAKPVEVLLVIDAMLGQESVNIAEQFHKAVGITGSILTKVDGDSRGGAALSICAVTGTSIKMMGVGEKIDAFEVFHPERIASRILGMGDVLSLIEQAQGKLNMKENAHLSHKMMGGGGINLEEFRNQIEQMNQLGGLQAIMDKLPFGDAMSQRIAQQGDMNKEFKRFLALIDSMTPQERKYPQIINSSRKNRICKGSGLQVSDLNKLMKHAKNIGKAGKIMKNKGKMMEMMKQLGAGSGFSPPSFPQK